MNNLPHTVPQPLRGRFARQRRHIATLTSACATLGLLAAPVSAQCVHDKIDDPIPGRIPASSTRIELGTVMNKGLVAPVAGAVAPGLPNRIFVADQVGKVWSIEVYGSRRGEATLFLDVSSKLVPLGLFKPLNYDERGLLGVAFHPDFERNGLFYTFSSEPGGHKPDFTTSVVPRAPLSPGEVEEQSVIREWRVLRSSADDVRVDVNSSRVLMRIAKPQFNHNGGMLAFGPDHLLYISLGDGGNANDEGPGHVPGGNAQSLGKDNVLGKILRIDPLGRNSANKKYGIPPGNPFVGRPGADEIYARGFRNPYRMSFDAKSNQLWVGDVGQNDIEEVDIVRAGQNYGWPVKEGTFLFDDGACRGNEGFVYRNSPGTPVGLVDPIAQYDHVDGAGTSAVRVAAVGGFVYRGLRIEGLKGRYVFGDYSAEIGEVANGHLFVLGTGDRVTELVATNRRPLKLAVLGWAQDQRGELYLLANGTGTLNGATGVVLKLRPAGREANGDDE